MIWLYKGIKNVISRSWFEYCIIKPVFKNICNIYDESIRVMCETKYINRHKNLGKVYSSWFSWDKVFCFEICIFLTVKVEEINILQFNLITLLTCNLKHLVIWVSYALKYINIHFHLYSKCIIFQTMMRMHNKSLNTCTHLKWCSPVSTTRRQALKISDPYLPIL